MHEFPSIAEGDSKGADSWALSKLNLEENEQDEKTNTAGYPDLLQSRSNEDSKVLA